MHFDDRLGTVLRARADSNSAVRTQFRQLIDLLGTMPSQARSNQVDAAWERLAQISETISAKDRAAALEEPGLRLRSPRVVIALAHSETPVASAAVRAARLTEGEWLDLIPALPPTLRRVVRMRQDLTPRTMELLARLGATPQALPPAGKTRQLAANDEQSAAHPPEGIGAIVQRIEAYRKRRAESDERTSAMQLSGQDASVVPASPVSAFSFTSDEAGRIVWADPGVAPAVTGLQIGSRDESSPAVSTASVIDAVRWQQPVRAGILTISGAPALAGDWQVDAVPTFGTSGQFTGYMGRFRRTISGQEAASAPAADSHSDRVRQMLHELRTPVNAIQGFAEVIQQQLFGPTPHEYRAHAAAIAGDAARMLAGFDELERMAKLDSGALTLEPGQSDLAAICKAIGQQLDSHLAQRGGGFDLAFDEGAMPVAFGSAEAERLAWRLLATLAGATAPGERLKLRMRIRRGMVRLSATLPESLAAQDDIFRAAAPVTPTTLSAGMFGAGFALRLVATEVRAAGGTFVRRDSKVRLELPECAIASATEAEGQLYQK